MSELARLLQDAGSSYDPAGVEALIEGVLGAPAEVGTGWHVLVADRVSPALADALETLRAHMAAGHRDGLSGEDFTRLPRAERLAALRRELAARGLDGFIVPRADEHQGEYVPPRGQRLAWLTGFTGSAGLAIVLPERAALFVDGRYTLQAAAQVDAALFEIHHLIDEPPSRWLAAALETGMTLGYDPWLHTPQDVERFRAAAEKARGDVARGRRQPARPRLAGTAGRTARAGGAARLSASPARARRQSATGSAAPWPRKGSRRSVLTMPESIAWLLNIRGGDVPHTPLPLSFAILRRDGSVALFIDRRKLAPGLERHLGNEVAVDAARRAGAGARRARRRGRPGAGRPGKCRLVDFRPARTGAGAKSTAPPTRACCPRPARTGSKSTARGRRTAATAPR